MASEIQLTGSITLHRCRLCLRCRPINTTRADAKPTTAPVPHPRPRPSPRPGAFLTRAVAGNHNQVTVPMPPQRRAAAASEAQPTGAEDAAPLHGSRKVQIITTLSGPEPASHQHHTIWSQS